MFRQTIIAIFMVLVTVTSAFPQLSTNCDLALMKVRQGEPISDEERLACRNELIDLYEILCRKHEVNSNTAFPEPDRTLYYISAIKTAIVDPIENGGWAFRSSIRLLVLDQLRSMMLTTNDPFLAFCAIFPALDHNDTSYAVTCFEIIKEHDAFLADLAMKWSFQSFRDPNWLLTYYLTSGQRDEAKEAGDMAAATGLITGLEANAQLLDQLGEHAKAEEWCQELAQRYDYVGALVWFYRKHSGQKDEAGISYQQRFDDLTTRCFPKGLRTANLADVDGPPVHGVSFMSENRTMRRNGLRKDMVICAVDGYLVENLTQYYFVRELDSKNPQMALTVWDGKNYKDITVTLHNRRLGVDLINFEQTVTLDESDASHGSTMHQTL